MGFATFVVIDLILLFVVISFFNNYDTRHHHFVHEFANAYENTSYVERGNYSWSMEYNEDDCVFSNVTNCIYLRHTDQEAQDASMDSELSSHYNIPPPHKFRKLACVEHWMLPFKPNELKYYAVLATMTSRASGYCANQNRHHEISHWIGYMIYGQEATFIACVFDSISTGVFPTANSEHICGAMKGKLSMRPFQRIVLNSLVSSNNCGPISDEAQSVLVTFAIAYCIMIVAYAFLVTESTTILLGAAKKFGYWTPACYGIGRNLVFLAIHASVLHGATTNYYLKFLQTYVAEYECSAHSSDLVFQMYRATIVARVLAVAYIAYRSVMLPSEYGDEFVAMLMRWWNTKSVVPSAEAKKKKKNK